MGIQDEIIREFAIDVIDALEKANKEKNDKNIWAEIAHHPEEVHYAIYRRVQKIMKLRAA